MPSSSPSNLQCSSSIAEVDIVLPQEPSPDTVLNDANLVLDLTELDGSHHRHRNVQRLLRKVTENTLHLREGKSRQGEREGGTVRGGEEETERETERERQRERQRERADLEIFWRLHSLVAEGEGEGTFISEREGRDGALQEGHACGGGEVIVRIQPHAGWSPGDRRRHHKVRLLAPGTALVILCSGLVIF
jgi:hypothetical protein